MRTAQVDNMFKLQWQDYLAIYSSTRNSQQLLERPEATCDKWVHGKQVTFHEPVLIDVGTSSIDDLGTIIKDLLARDPRCLYILEGD